MAQLEVVKSLSPGLVEISDNFVSARMQGRALKSFPGTLPDKTVDAYAIQSRSISSWPDQVAGWKVGMVPPSFQHVVGADRLVGPIFKRSIIRAGSDPSRMPVFEGGFAAVEAEIVLVVAQDIKPTTKLPKDWDPADFISDVKIGVEIASSPLHSINELGPMSIISDFGNNAGLVLGSSIQNWRDNAFLEQTVSVNVDGMLVGKSKPAAIVGGPFESFKFLVQSCIERNFTLERGAFVSTGAITGVHEVSLGNIATADFGLSGRIEVNLCSAEPSL